MRNLRMTALAAVWISALPAVASAGTITKVTASPAVVVTGQTVTFTEEGPNPCGASNMTYGDGIVITYAITELPARQTHVYEKPGTYTVIARGMGNCDGEATTTVQVKPAAAPPPEPTPTGPRVTSVEFVPAQGVIRRPITFVVNGVGECRFTATFGDGNSREVSAQLPSRFAHTYAVAGNYTTIIKPEPPCSGRFTQVLNVSSSRTTAAARILDLTINPSPTDAGRPITLTVDGNGSCGYAIDFGDGNNDSRTGNLPDRLQHNYPAAGNYDITVTAIPPCTGSARRVVRVRER